MHAADPPGTSARGSRRAHALYGVALACCAVGFWVVIPVLWFVVGMAIESRGGSKTFSILVTHGGLVVAVACAVKVISVFERAYTGQRFLPRGVARKRTPIEPAFVIGAALAMIAGLLWLGPGGGCASAPMVCPL